MMAASLVVKVIGAFFQIPLQNLIGGEKSPAFGMFSAAYRIYTAMLVVSTVGLPAALSKMVAEATARGREHEVRRIVRVAAGIFVPVGALCSLALFFGAGTFAAWIKSEDSRLAVMAIAPSVLMVAILSVFRGYYQGRSNMVPTAVSQVIEAAGKLFIGLGLACWAVGRGFDDPVVAALTVLGVTIGEVVGPQRPAGTGLRHACAGLSLRRARLGRRAPVHRAQRGVQSGDLPRAHRHELHPPRGGSRRRQKGRVADRPHEEQGAQAHLGLRRVGDHRQHLCGSRNTAWPTRPSRR